MLNGAAPDFALEGGIALALARGLTDAALVSVFGALLFRTVILPRGSDAGFARVLARVIRASAFLGALSIIGWLVLETRTMAGDASPGAVCGVLAGTLFGHLIAGQFVLLMLAAGVPIRWAMIPGFVALVLQAGHSHAWSMTPGLSLLLGSDLLHLVAAGAWLGGLLPLLLLIRIAPAQAAVAARRFSPMGIAAVLALAGTALFQGSVLIDSWPALIGSAYGWMALVKAALFAALLACASANRAHFTPALTRGDARWLARSVTVETILGLAVVFAAATLSGLEPGMHVEPVWPFTWRPSLEAVSADPDFLREVEGAALALAGACLLLVLAVFVRRWRRWGAVAAALIVAGFAAPHLDLLFVEAYPTSYFHSPSGFAAASIVAGSKLFPTHCAVCHGAEGRGDGPAARSLPEPPADLTAAHLWMHSDGELFWWLSHGIPTPEGQPAMPGFAGELSPEARWALIDYIRGHNAGLVAHRTGAWDPPLQAPGFDALCADGRNLDAAELRGQILRLVIGSPAPDVPGLLTILATSDPAIRPVAGRCVVRDETVPLAYAIVTGLAPSEAAGAEFLIDANGWLRAVHVSGTSPGWDAPHLAAELRRIHDSPIKASNAQMDMPM